MESNSALVSSISPKDHDKLRGGFYTSHEVAAWLCDWAILNQTDRILEPSCGDGVFLSAAVDRLRKLGVPNIKIINQLVGIELFPSEIDKSHLRLKSNFINSNGMVHCGDFFGLISRNDVGMYNCVVGNPPFIRYQNFPEPSRSMAMSIMKSVGLSPNRLTNIWVPFVVASTNLLLPGGRLAMVLPAELLQVSYSAQLRSFLVDQFNSIDIVTCNQMIFDRAEQEVVLFLADGRKSDVHQRNSCLISLLETDSVEDILSIDIRSPEHKKEMKEVNHDNEKWLKYFLTQSEISLMRELRESSAAVELKNYGHVYVGVVTGKNEFFVLGKNDINNFALQPHTIPLIGRSCQLKGSIISKEEYSLLADEGNKVFLFYPRPLLNDGLSIEAKRYIIYGETKGFHTGYKCSIRPSWYKVLSVWSPDFFFFRQISLLSGRNYLR